MRAFLQKVAAAISRHQMIAPGQIVLVALSGGADSVALLHALKQLGHRLCACHVHHGLRGKDADADAQHAATFAASLGLPCVEKHADIRCFAKEHKLSLETAAREVRYALLEEAAKGMKADLIATGHTADDQAETVLLNLLRGAGPAGLAGIPPVRDTIIRPFLAVTRAEARDYCAAEGLGYREDRSNLDLRFTRNRVRHEVIPLLRQVQPGVVSALCRVAEIMRAENEFAGSAAAHALATSAAEEEGGLSVLLSALQALPLAIRRRVLRTALTRVKGDALDLELERVDALVALAERGRTGAVIEFPGGWRAERTYHRLVVRPAVSPSAAPGEEWSFSAPGEIAVPELGIRLTAALSDDLAFSDDALSAVLDAEEAGTKLAVRTLRRGDRFAPLGMEGWYLLSDFFIEAKVPRAQRGWTPLVVSRRLGHIVWVVGHRINDRYKVTETTRQTIRLQAMPLHLGDD